MSAIKNRQSLEEYPIHEGATVTANATSSWFNCEGFHNLRLNLSVSGAVGGTNPTLDIQVEAVGRTQLDGFSLGTMTQITATSASETKIFDIRAVAFFRIKTTIGGTNSPSFADTDLDFAIE